MGHEPATQLDLCDERWVCFSGSPASWILGHIFSKACTLGPGPSRQHDLDSGHVSHQCLYLELQACYSVRPVPWAPGLLLN
jgi:hypothetical protein